MERNIEGSVEVKLRRRRIPKELLDNFKEKKVYRKLKREALDSPLWRTRFGRVYWPVGRETADWMN